MKNKILLIIYVPMLEKNYNVYVPVAKKVGTIRKLIAQIIADDVSSFKDDGTASLYDKVTGDLIVDNDYIKNSGLKNGTKLIYY